MSTPPENPRIYRIVHVDHLASIIQDRFLWSDAVMLQKQRPGTSIAIGEIKKRRFRASLTSQPGLHVGECVPFYFCPRSVMLYLVYRGNHPNLEYRGGQRPIVHLEADLRRTVDWAEEHGKRWAFTLSNAGSHYFEDRSSLNQLTEIDWEAVNARQWSGPGIPEAVKEHKQSEFLVEERFPWNLVERIGTCSPSMSQRVLQLVQGSRHKPLIEIRRGWYY